MAVRNDLAVRAARQTAFAGQAIEAVSSGLGHALIWRSLDNLGTTPNVVAHAVSLRRCFPAHAWEVK